MNAYLVGEITSITPMLKVSQDKWLEDHLWVTPPFKSFWKENMKELQIDGILESFDFESIDTYENFLEMIKTLFVGRRRMDD
jgi:hypothetical protein